MIRKFDSIPGHCRHLADYGCCPFVWRQYVRHFDGFVTSHPSQVEFLLKFRLRDERTR